MKSPGHFEDMVLVQRKERIEAVLARRTRSIVAVAEDLEDPHNLAAILRTCEGFGIQEVHAITRRYTFRANARITQGAEKWLDVSLYRDPKSCIEGLKARGYRVAGTSLAPGSKSLLELPADQKVALVFGNEKDGLSPEAHALCDDLVQIPMQGFSQSLNVSVAAAVCLSHLVFQRLARYGKNGDLDPADYAALRDRFFALAVKQRHRIFKGDKGQYLNLPGPNPSKPQEEP